MRSLVQSLFDSPPRGGNYLVRHVEKSIASLAEEVLMLKELSEQKTSEPWMLLAQPEIQEGQQQMHAQGRNQIKKYS
jgi:hypothetical protein